MSEYDDTNIDCNESNSRNVSHSETKRNRDIVRSNPYKRFYSRAKRLS